MSEKYCAVCNNCIGDNDDEGFYVKVEAEVDGTRCSVNICEQCYKENHLTAEEKDSKNTITITKISITPL